MHAQQAPQASSQAQVWSIQCRRSFWWRALATFLGASILAGGFAIAAALKEVGVRGKTAGAVLPLAFLVALAVVGALFMPAKGELSLGGNALSFRTGSRVRTFPLVGATSSYGKWMQQYVGVKGSILYLASAEGALSIGGEGFVFQHPAWYRQGVHDTCDIWLSKDAFRAFHDAFTRVEQGLAPPPPPPPEPVDHGYRQPGFVLPEPVVPQAIPSWVEVELERNPASSEAQSYYFLRSIGIVLGILLLYGLGMGLWFGVHEGALEPEMAVGIGVAMACLGLAALVFFALRKTYGVQLRIEQGILRVIEGPKTHAIAPMRDVRFEHGVYTVTSKGTTYRQPTLLLLFPGGKVVSLGSHGVDLAVGSPRPSGPPTYLVGFAEWEPLARALRHT